MLAMPTLIPRQQALDEIAAVRAGAPCLMCAIVARGAGPVYVIAEDETHLVSLPRYVRRWGQVLVTPKRHVTSYLDVDDGVWSRSNELALRAARMVERVLRPRRVYLASTGSSGGELVNCSTHLHVHVVPVYEPDDRPADIFSWSSGIYVADEGEWQALRTQLVVAW
jgi:diadenosine tetraphosphate (Ap4A) HIT family hydrolase